jgi:ABC-type uncharacterized transport system substrate-binding protein
MLLRAMAFCMAAAPIVAQSAASEVAVVYRSGSDVYEDALSGLRESVAGAPYRFNFIDLAKPSGDPALAAMLAAPPKLVAALGVGAWEKLRDPRLKVVPAVVLRQDVTASGRRPEDAVYADVPLVAVIEQLKQFFPARTRVGLIYRSGWPVPDAAALARAKQMGYEVVLLECAGPEKLLQAFSSLKGKADFVIALPDTELYNSATVKPLVLASLEERLPIVGFSAGFVRAGALAGVYPDFRDLGRQTGELVERLLAGQNQHAEMSPNKVVVAINERVVRLLGIQPHSTKGAEVFQ